MVLGGISALFAFAQPPAMQRGPTRSPHGAMAIPCGSCHTSLSWAPQRAMPEFNHNRETRYPLRAMHEKVECRLCHTRLVFRDTATRCVECHADIHRRQFGSDCEQCHSVRGWQVGAQSVRDHSPRFPLMGAHAAVDCEACHKGAGAAQYTGLSTQCGTCHIADYNNTRIIPHRAAGFSLACETCHSLNGWLSVQFDHARFTGFALVGAHARLVCTDCHAGNRFQGTPADCYSCHTKEYAATNNPNHVTAGFPTTCSLCHGSDSWLTATFNHATTKFPLTGAHVTTPCAQCHVNNRFAGTPTQCQACHLADFTATTNPNHVTAGFPQDCSVCHSTTNWLNAAFDHSKTSFPLTGAHTALACAACHVNGQFTALSAACVSCHLANFNSTTNPNHTTAGFPQTCEVCHTTTAWTPASFNHGATKFPLTGAHVSVPCASCHVNNVFAGTPVDCYSCHKVQYQSTTDPNHAASAFPTTCADCHTTTTWSGAVFNHTWFPIYSGAHARKWTTCADCHTNSGNYQVFSCITCHTHDQASTDPRHRGVRNYVYSPTSCYSCHRNGQGD